MMCQFAEVLGRWGFQFDLLLLKFGLQATSGCGGRASEHGARDGGRGTGHLVEKEEFLLDTD